LEALVICTAAMTGCSLLTASYSPGTDANTEAEVTEEPQEVMEQPHPLLAAARADRIDMFGDLANDSKNMYFTRSVVSLRQHTFTEVGGDLDPDADSTGRRVVFASTRHNTQPDLYLKQVDGVAVTQLTSDPGADVQPAFSPDDSRVAFASNRTGNWDIWMVGIDGGQPIQVTSGLADEVHPSWSPDGSKLAFCSLPQEGGQWELWIADAVAGSTKKFIGYGLFPEWSPVADTIVYQRARERASRWFSIWTITLVDGEPRYPTEVAAGAHQAMTLPTWSPDGQRIAFASSETLPPDGTPLGAASGVFDIWMMRVDGRGKIRLTDGHTLNYAPVFAGDERVLFTSNRSGHENIWSVLPAGQAITASDSDTITDVPGRAITAPPGGAETTADAGAVREGT
jgi:Tol biopolymer transport system component